MSLATDDIVTVDCPYEEFRPIQRAMKDPAWTTWALSDSSRLRILWLLLAHPGGVCVCEIVDALRMPRYPVSRHLGVLRKVGLVARNKRGRWYYFEIRSHRLPLVPVLLKGLALASQSGTTWEDRERFDKRVSLRIDGACVVGYEPDRPFRHEIPVCADPVDEGTATTA